MLEMQFQAEFRSRIAAYLRKHLPDHTRESNKDELDHTIRQAQIEAAGYGVASERGIAKWCYLWLALGPTFHTQPDIHEYLRRDIPAPDEKVDNLMRTLGACLQVEAKSG